MNSIAKNLSRVIIRAKDQSKLLRCSSSSTTTVKQENTDKKDYPLNSSITSVFVNNRNPRNLEKLRIAEKPDGWDLEKPGKNFWNKIALEITGKHITARILHVYGRVPVSVSTNEWCVKKYLYSTKDATAAKVIGQVLAHRCLQVGITEVACFFSEEERKKDKVGTFLTAFEDGGVALEEPGQFLIPWSLTTPRFPEKPWEIHEEVNNKMEEASKILKIMDKVNTKKRS